MALSLVFGELSCTPTSPTSEAPSATVPPSPPPLPGLDVLAALRAAGVVSTQVGRRTLYTWTTRDQIEALARDRVLLTRTESPVHGPAYYDQVVAGRAAAGDTLALALRAPMFARSRHAWPLPWATVLGWPGETYGDELIEVELRPTAWIAKLLTGKPGWEIVDLDDRTVPLAEVLLHPERIAAVYFMNDTPGTGYGHTFAGPAERSGFREYVLCNEAMIAAWSIGTPRISQTLAGAADLIDALRPALLGPTPPLPSIDAWNADVVRAVWPGPEVSHDLERAYEAALAFPNENYAPTPERLDTLSRKLRSLTVRGPALTVSPPRVMPPPAPALAPKPSTPRPRPRRGTY